MQGLGLYTLEELKYSPSGLLYTRGPSQYKIPAVCDMPLQFNVYLLPDTYNPHAIYSSKVSPETSSFCLLLCWKQNTRGICLNLQGIGEPALFLGSSCFFAIKDAVAAARSNSGLVGPFTLDSPATPERACLACATPFTRKVTWTLYCPYSCCIDTWRVRKIDSLVHLFGQVTNPEEISSLIFSCFCFQIPTSEPGSFRPWALNI